MKVSLTICGFALTFALALLAITHSTFGNSRLSQSEMERIVGASNPPCILNLSTVACTALDQDGNSQCAWDTTTNSCQGPCIFYCNNSSGVTSTSAAGSAYSSLNFQANGNGCGQEVAGQGTCSEAFPLVCSCAGGGAPA